MIERILDRQQTATNGSKRHQSLKNCKPSAGRGSGASTTVITPADDWHCSVLAHSNRIHSRLFAPNRGYSHLILNADSPTYDTTPAFGLTDSLRPASAFTLTSPPLCIAVATGVFLS